MYCNADVLERLLFYGKPFAGALGKKMIHVIISLQNSSELVNWAWLKGTPKSSEKNPIVLSSSYQYCHTGVSPCFESQMFGRNAVGG